ncbi:MAG: LpxD N-terminal domain-containing protein, partial [Gemmatimonadota bacterium]|nr:LpxD N-terminal domain-containing protein [Gemmatimonadota bacterium]
MGEIAEKISGRVEGDSDIIISGVAGLDDAREGDISFLANPKYLSHLTTTRAAAVIIDRKNGSMP